MTVVSNTSPLNYLVLIGEGDVLPKLYGSLLIPQTVSQELRAPQAPAAVREWSDALPAWIKVSTDPLPPAADLEHLHAGERDAISLALHVRADALLIDERHGREEAQRRGLRVVGTVGVLAAAHERGLLDLPAAFARLGQTSFHISPRLLAAILRRYEGPAGEERREGET